MLFQAIDNIEKSYRMSLIFEHQNFSRYKLYCMKFHKILVNIFLITMAVLCLAKIAWPDMNKLPIFWITLSMTTYIYVFITYSLVYSKIPNQNQKLWWAGVSIYISSFWIAWQIIEQPDNPEYYIVTLFGSIFYGFVGVAVCFFLSHVSDRLKKTW